MSTEPGASPMPDPARDQEGAMATDLSDHSGWLARAVDDSIDALLQDIHAKRRKEAPTATDQEIADALGALGWSEIEDAWFNSCAEDEDNTLRPPKRDPPLPKEGYDPKASWHTDADM